MIDLRNIDKATTRERKFEEQLNKEGIKHGFGEVRIGNETSPKLFIVDNFAISFEKLSATMETHLRQNKLVTQKWHESEIDKWHDLGLHRSLMLHK